MPRPLRIEYGNAIYHVMNRGRGRQLIFHNDDYFRAFLETLEAACCRFGSIVHAYCLMGNHYHLLIQTPLANLSQVMRHVNSIYTQRYNRLKHTDGSLFRGRYKSILVSQDEYFLQVSRYIHRNPVETQIPLVSDLSDFVWSSYPCYLGHKTPPPWLDLDFTRRLLSANTNPISAYRNFVMKGNDKQTVKFHKSHSIGAVFGSDSFRNWVFDDLIPQLNNEDKVRVITPNLSIFTVITGVARFYSIDIKSIINGQHGKVSENIPRKVAIHLCQELTGSSQAEISQAFNLGNYCSVGHITYHIRLQKRQNAELASQLEEIMMNLLKR